MAGWGDWVELKTGEGSPVRVGDTTVTPVSQALVLRTPWLGRGGSGAAATFVWNRPVAVLVERAGRVERRPIVDVTRILVWTILAAGLLARWRLAAARRNNRRS